MVLKIYRLLSGNPAGNKTKLRILLYAGERKKNAKGLMQLSRSRLVVFRSISFDGLDYNDHKAQS